MKPPVEAPMSRQTFPFTSMPKRSSAPSSFKPPRLTNFGGVRTLKLCVVGDEEAGLGGRMTIDADLSGDDESLRLLARGAERFLHERLIEPDAGHLDGLRIDHMDHLVASLHDHASGDSGGIEIADRFVVFDRVADGDAYATELSRRRSNLVALEMRWLLPALMITKPASFSYCFTFAMVGMAMICFCRDVSGGGAGVASAGAAGGGNEAGPPGGGGCERPEATAGGVVVTAAGSLDAGGADFTFGIGVGAGVAGPVPGCGGRIIALAGTAPASVCACCWRLMNSSCSRTPRASCWLCQARSPVTQSKIMVRPRAICVRRMEAEFTGFGAGRNG